VIVGGQALRWAHSLPKLPVLGTHRKTSSAAPDQDHHRHHTGTCALCGTLRLPRPPRPYTVSALIFHTLARAATGIHSKNNTHSFTSPSKGYKRCFIDGYSTQVYPTGGSSIAFGVGQRPYTAVHTIIHTKTWKIEATVFASPRSPELSPEATQARWPSPYGSTLPQ
jgi:hypothetical protein